MRRAEIFNLTYSCDQPFQIEKIYQTKGFTYPCHTCKTPNTAYQYAVINGIGEPQGSIYYCEKCNPNNIEAVRRHYLKNMGYTY